MKFFKKLRADSSLIQVNLTRFRVNALYSEALGKYVVSLQSVISSPELRKRLGFSKMAFFSIIFDIEEEVYFYVINQKIIKAWVIGDCCDVVDCGTSFSMFWRNQTEPTRELRLYLGNGEQLRFTKRGTYIVRRDEEIKLEGAKNGK